jgi:hypothetical protein
VNWTRVCQDKKLGDLASKDLSCFNGAVRLRWPWLQWTELTKPWAALPIKLTNTEQALLGCAPQSI